MAKFRVVTTKCGAGVKYTVKLNGEKLAERFNAWQAR